MGRVEGSDERKIVNEKEDTERLEGKHTAFELQSVFF